MKQPMFRGIEKETGTWVYGFGWMETDYTDDYLDELQQSQQDALLFTTSGMVLCHLHTMSRSTEQADSNNVLLFEGDVCHFTPMLVENQVPFRGEIIWDKARFAIQNLDYNQSNLHSTPLVGFDSFGMDVQFIKTIYDDDLTANTPKKIEQIAMSEKETLHKRTEAINAYYHEELEKALSIMYQLEEIELKYGVKLPKHLEKEVYDFVDAFRFRYADLELKLTKNKEKEEK